MTYEELIVGNALQLLGLPWVHQGRSAQTGCDCVGVGVLAARGAGLTVQDFLGYGEDPNPATFERYLEANCDRLNITRLQDAPLGSGLVFWLVDRCKMQHFAIRSQIGMIHARRRRDGSGKVIEHELNRFWIDHFHSAWRYKWPQ